MVMPDKLARFVSEVKAARSAVIAMSPHLDDAILSCGALIADLVRQCPITVVSVFTAASPAPWPWPARRQMRAIGASDAESFFARRRAEDLAVLAEVGAVAVHLGLRDALFRRVRSAPDGLPGVTGRPAYPTFRFDAARGRVASADAGLDAVVARRVDEVAQAADARVILAPLGIGRHVDHLITRSAARFLELRVVYYSDFPYSEKSAPESEFIRRASLVPHPWLHGRAENARRIAGYQTQVRGLFPNGMVPTRPEVYWFTDSDSALPA
jgi:LmbE family N-acetylglucosaminyl deacetylase